MDARSIIGCLTGDTRKIFVSYIIRVNYVVSGRAMHYVAAPRSQLKVYNLPSYARRVGLVKGLDNI